MQTNDAISTLEFKRIVFDIWEHAPATRIRVRVMGQLWMKNYVQIVHITGSNAMIVQDKDQMKHVSINDVAEFEVEAKFQDFNPHNHYQVKFP
jgi:hypothetical protein